MTRPESQTTAERDALRAQLASAREANKVTLDRLEQRDADARAAIEARDVAWAKVDELRADFARSDDGWLEVSRRLERAEAEVGRLEAALKNEADEQAFLKLAAKSADHALDAARADVARLRALLKQTTDFARRHRCGLACDCKSAQDRMERLARIDAEVSSPATPR